MQNDSCDTSWNLKNRAALLGCTAILVAGCSTEGADELASKEAAGLEELPVVAAGQAPHPKQFRITVTNLTRGQQFTPILVATHRAGVTLFTEGSPASMGLQLLAEEGNTAPLTAELDANPDVLAVVTAPPLLDPGASRSIDIATDDSFDHVSVASMLIPTNDAFFAVNGVNGTDGDVTRVVYSPAYDAGSEVNDECCKSIPGPFFVECGGPGGGAAPSGGEEGFVHIHAGIHGIRDLDESERDWRNPVAKIVIQRIP